VTKLAEHRRLLELVERHPGWGARRLARAVGVSPSTAHRWRVEAGYPPALKRVGTVNRRRRVQVVPLSEALRRRLHLRQR
jgi:DNA-binding IclR family transcriptional regulator